MPSPLKRKRDTSSSSAYNTPVRVSVPTAAKVMTEAQVKAYFSKVLRQRGLTPEIKFRTSALSGSAVTAGGSVDCLCVIDQGTEDYQRVGDRIGIKSLEIRGYVSSGNTLPYDQVSLAVFIDKQINGAASALTVNVGSTTAAPFMYYSGGAPAGSALVRNQDWKERFTIKTHRQVHANQQSPTLPYEVANFTIKINFKTPLMVEYSTSAATVAAVSTNGLMFGYSNISGGSTISYIAQIAYVDV